MYNEDWLLGIITCQALEYDKRNYSCILPLSKLEAENESERKQIAE